MTIKKNYFESLREIRYFIFYYKNYHLYKKILIYLFNSDILILFKNKNKIHLLLICLIYLIFYFVDHNDGLLVHGLYNFIVFVIISIILFLMILILHFTYFLFYKKKYYIIILIILFFFFSQYKFKIYKFKNFSCQNWSKGFNDSIIDNLSKDYPCKIIFPKPNSCYISGIGAFFDFTSLYRPNCSNLNLMKNNKKKFLSIISFLINWKKNIYINNHNPHTIKNYLFVKGRLVGWYKIFEKRLRILV